MNRKGKVLVHNTPAGIISEEEDGYQFKYFKEYIENKNAQSVSLSLPLKEEPFISKTMFPFFDGLIPEGWLLNIAQKTWKLNPRDRMGLLLACCRDCIGAISVIPMEEGYK
ncbi:phosphatidylinositol kinase [candidate division TA06 bacterium]|uniref:Phosphatidylinositol kinase n=1 Tax=candidate division TA06 bacterium TaxID=2250710 RepID=A0A660SH86_UNCT6|nr:MAG: phosphatidylinositol kinase [candidate division TA06 bacterium]